MKKQLNLRSLAAQAVEALLQELCFGVLRTLSQLDWLIGKLMSRPMSGKQRVVHYLIMVGIYQLLYTRIPPHAALAETVEGAVAIKRPQLKGLINGVLRQFQRQQEELLSEFSRSEIRFLHPSWLLKRLQKAYPAQWEAIVEANNQRPPMWLRVNRTHHPRDTWLALLEEAGMKGFTHPAYPDAVRMETPVPRVGLPFRMPPLRAASHFLIQKTASKFWICAQPRGVKPRIFSKRRPKHRCWPSMLMSSDSPASMTT